MVDHSQPFDEEAATVYFSMLLKDQKLFRVAVDYIEPEFFKNLFPLNDSYFHLWLCLKPAVIKYKNLKLTPDLVLKGCFTALKLIYEEEEAKELAPKLAVFYKKLISLDVVPDRQLVLEYTRQVMQQGNVVPQLADLSSQAELGVLEAADAVKQVADLSRQLGPSERPTLDPLDIAALPEEVSPEDLVKTYIDWFDSSIGGGMVKDEPHTLIMPTGQGKTTVASQIAGSRARRGESTLVIITEGGLSRQVVSKTLAATLNMPAKIFEMDATNPLSDLDSLTADQKDWYAAARGKIRMVDLVDHGEGISWVDVIGEYEKSVSEGFQPGLIIIDWAGLLAKSLVDNNVYKDQHMALEHIAISCTHFCKEYNVPILITQQVTAAIAETKGCSPSYTVQDVDGCKKWSNHFCNSVISTKFDKQDFGTMFFEKVRYGIPNQQVVVKRLGAFSQFKKAETNMVYKNGAYRDIDSVYGDFESNGA